MLVTMYPRLVLCKRCHKPCVRREGRSKIKPFQKHFYPFFYQCPQCKWCKNFKESLLSVGTVVYYTPEQELLLQEESRAVAQVWQTEVPPRPLRIVSYAEYLQSPHWQNVRMTALDYADFRCQVCNSGESLDVHHREYTRVWQELKADVFVLCRVCHSLFTKYGRLAPVPREIQVPGHKVKVPRYQGKHSDRGQRP